MTSARYRSCCKPAPVSDGGEAGERSQVEGSGLRWRGLRGAVSGGGERSLMEGSGFRRRGTVSGGEERSQVEGSDRW